DADSPKLLPAIPSIERNLVLARLIKEKSRFIGDEQAFALAVDLARLMDTVEMEELGFENLERLVPENLSEYWSQTVEFLKIITEFYPAILAERSYMNPTARKVALIRRRADSLGKESITAAGSTGSLKPIAYLLDKIASTPNGAVVLPGLDRFIGERDFAAVGQNHPQYGMMKLLGRMGITRNNVVPLAKSQNPARELLASAIMLAGEATAAWHDIKEIPPAALENISRLSCETEREEAKAIALALADSQARGETAELITPDRKIAKSVADELAKFGIAADDSAGTQASETAAGNYMIVALKAAVKGFAPLPLLALIKHGFTSLPGKEETTLRLERETLRGHRNLNSLADISAASPPAIQSFLRHIEDAANEMMTLLREPAAPLHTLLTAHIRMTEAFAGPDSRLYDGDMGTQLSDTLQDTLTALEKIKDDDISLINPASYLDFISQYLFSINLRPRRAATAKIAILNSMEARLLHPDFTVVAGLNEQTFPRITADDPWMSRPMKSAFGLPCPERKIGLGSHDFSAGFCMPRVLMSRSRTAGGEDAIKSRWLQKLDAILQIANAKLEDGFPSAIVRTLTRSEHVEPSKIQRPAPRPPAAARPKKLYATSVEKWYRDPYIIYARYILKLKKLDDFEPEITPADFGTVVHESLEEFARADGADAAELLKIMIRRAAPIMDVQTMDFWMDRFRRISEFFAKYEAERAPAIARKLAETEGSARMANDFELCAKADRIDVLTSGAAVISDYKTGAPPTKRELNEGFAPQLPLEALILERGGFSGIKAKVAELRFVALGQNKVQVIDKELDALIADAEKKLNATIQAFTDENTPYISRPNPSKVGRAIEEYSEYSHLARVREWEE
ncbi:MAG: double-strand break repair protein AddB, partial [Rickettsiales bacterium]|nr:double-strand break repair protein AddB [Rickettsiales bacterium]